LLAEPAPGAKPTFLARILSRKMRKKLRDRFLHMVGGDDPPEVVAASFAVGVAIAFTPLLGFHWIMALLFAFLLKLNKVDVLLGTLVVNPLTLGPVSALAIWVGRVLLRARREAIHHLPWGDLFKRTFWTQAGPAVKTYAVSWIVGMFVLALVAGALTYFVLIRLIRKWREHHAAHHHAPPE